MRKMTDALIAAAVELTNSRRVYHPHEVDRIIAAGAAVLDRQGRTRAEDRMLVIAENLARGRGVALESMAPAR